jgi:hypothetical protein
MVRTGIDTLFEDNQLGCWQDFLYKSTANYTEEELFELKNKLTFIKNAIVFKVSSTIPNRTAFDLIVTFADYGVSFVETVLCSYDKVGKYTFDYIKDWIEPIVTNHYQALYDADQEYNENNTP